MIVPNFVPEPLEVPGSVQQEPYLFRVAYIRRVTLLHLASLLAATALAFVPWPALGIRVPIAGLAVSFLALDLWRIRFRGQAVEAKVSALSLPFLVLLTAWAGREGAQAGWPVAAPLAGAVCATIYTFLCGRDFSFVGGALLAFIVSTVVLAGFSIRLGYSPRHAGAALGVNGAFLFYMEYDLASLLARRARGEEFAAVVDLYRDVFNFFGYILRVWKHWQKHRIWEVPGFRF